jgi:hypothetical protein
MERLEAITDRLNKAWNDFKSLPEEEKRDTDDVAAANLLDSISKEIGGGRISGGFGNGIRFSFVDKGEPSRTTIVYDGHTDKFLVGSENEIVATQIKTLTKAKAKQQRIDENNPQIGQTIVCHYKGNPGTMSGLVLDANAEQFTIRETGTGMKLTLRHDMGEIEILSSTWESQKKSEEVQSNVRHKIATGLER